MKKYLFATLLAILTFSQAFAINDQVIIKSFSIDGHEARVYQGKKESIGMILVTIKDDRLGTKFKAKFKTAKLAPLACIKPSGEEVTIDCVTPIIDKGITLNDITPIINKEVTLNGANQKSGETENTITNRMQYQVNRGKVYDLIILPSHIIERPGTIAFLEQQIIDGGGDVDEIRSWFKGTQVCVDRPTSYVCLH